MQAQVSLEGCPILSIDTGGQEVVCVRLLQIRLNGKGAAPKLDVDGDFGKLTDKAVKDFQTKQGLQVDGKVGRETKAALAIKPKPKPTPPGMYSPAMLALQILR